MEKLYSLIMKLYVIGWVTTTIVFLFMETLFFVPLYIFFIGLIILIGMLVGKSMMLKTTKKTITWAILLGITIVLVVLFTALYKFL